LAVQEAGLEAKDDTRRVNVTQLASGATGQLHAQQRQSGSWQDV